MTSHLPHDLDQRIKDQILAALPSPSKMGNEELARFAELQRDYPQRAGKGLRGRLVVASARAHGCSPEAALPVAAALELFQNWVLVHDDVEDDSETRRGRPALHRTVGVPVAINVGDAMHVAMWRILITGTYPQREAVQREFVDMIDETAAGQHLDLAWIERRRFDVGEAGYLDMVERKTARYTIVSPLRLGALLAGVQPDARIDAAGRMLGTAFQIRDDVLNLLPDEGGYGKEFVGDLYEGKRTLILAHALRTLPEAAGARLVALLDQPRAAKTEEQMHEALALLHRADAITFSQRVAERKAQEGMQQLQAIAASMPHQDGADGVLQLLGSLVDRIA